MNHPWKSLLLCVGVLGPSLAGGAQNIPELTADDRAALAAFEKDAAAAKASGATHVMVSADVPPALWQFDTPGDPYPGWFVARPNILKLFPPPELQPFVDLDYAKRVAAIVEERCKILRRHGLKGAWRQNEPQVLPDAFFVAHPRLRGARVDHPNRSRVARFAPCVDQPETLQLYRDALKLLWQRCPEIDTFYMVTSDSGSGFCWVPALYPGPNGNSACMDRPMADRVAGFLKNFQTAADEFGIKLSINLNPIGPRQWMPDSFSPGELESIVRALPPGMAVRGREGPDGRRYSGPEIYNPGGGGGGAFYPVVGLPSAPRTGRGNVVERATAQREAAIAEVGEALADELVNVWSSFDEAGTRLDALNFGAMLRFGHVLTRWINRPMVLFPDELKPEERDYYRAYLFQARSEEQADNLVDIQGMLMYQGWGAKMLFQRVIETTMRDMESALRSARRIAADAKDPQVRAAWATHVIRLEAAICLLTSADDMVSFQAHLDRVHDLDLKPEYDPPLGVQSDWARTDMINLYRREIDTTVRLIELLESTDERIIDTVATPEEEYDMRLGPNLVPQLRQKIATMNARWRDFDRVFTVPNI